MKNVLDILNSQGGLWKPHGAQTSAVKPGATARSEAAAPGQSETDRVASGRPAHHAHSMQAAHGPSPASPQERGSRVEGSTVVLIAGSRQAITLRPGQALTLELTFNPTLPGVWRVAEAPSSPTEALKAQVHSPTNEQGVRSVGGGSKTTTYTWQASALKVGGAAFRITLERRAQGRVFMEAGVDVRIEA